MFNSKRGQDSFSPLIYIAVAVSIMLIAAGGVYYFYKSSKKASEADYSIFSYSLNKKLETDSSQFGAVDTVSFSMPKNALEVCFIDRTRKFNDFYSNELTASANVYSDSNVFIKFQDGFQAFKVQNLKLEKESNPFCIYPKESKVNLVLENRGEFKDITSGSEKKEGDCSTILFNGNSDDKLDFVFVPSNYDDIAEFAEDIDSYVNELKNNPPFSSNLEKINIFRVDDVSALKCPVDQLIRCDEFAVHRLASQCPNDIVIVLHRDANFVMPARSSSVRNIVKITTLDKDAVVLHELGHLIGNLADEYVDENYYRNVKFSVEDYPNCDYSGCSKWSVSGCYEGCSLSEYYRPTEDSIMRTLSVVDYGPVNEAEMEKELVTYK